MPTVVTVTVKSAGGDYTSLASAEAGEQTNLVTDDVQLDIECYAFDDVNSSRLEINGWTTDATRYIRIFTPSAERHNGKWDTTAYRWRMNSGWASTFYGFWVQERYVRIEGIQISGEIDSGNGRQLVFFDDASDGYLSNCIVRVVPGPGQTGHYAVSMGHTNGPSRAWNNIIYMEGGAISGSVGLTNYTANFTYTSYYYNNTVYGFETGIIRGGGNGPILKNNLCNGNTTDYSGSFDAASTNNLSEDTSSPNSGLRSKAVTFVDEGNYDFHLASSDTNAIDAGTNLSADANIAFSDDIDGETRSGTWDIGADEYLSAGGSVFPWCYYAQL